MTYQEQPNEAAAIEVMGWHRKRGGWRDDKGNLADETVSVLWNPCRNWRDSRLVIRKMQENGFHLCLFFGDGDPEAIFEAADDRKGYYQDPNELIAITTAAIIAMGGLGALPIEKDGNDE